MKPRSSQMKKEAMPQVCTLYLNSQFKTVVHGLQAGYKIYVASRVIGRGVNDRLNLYYCHLK